MHAIVVREWGEPEVMKLEAWPDPKPGPGQVLVRVEAAGVNPVEAYIRSGAYARKPSLPWVPGTDAAGQVLACGEGVSRFRAGDRVYAFGAHSGAYAEQLVAAEGQLRPLPDDISYDQGAALGVPYATAHYALFARGRAVKGEWVLVHGASGAVGLAAVQLARGFGLRVIGTAGSEAGLAAVKEAGAEHVIDHRGAVEAERLLGLTDGRGVDLVVEMLANVNLDRDLQALAPKGRVLVVGSRGRVEIDPRALMGRDADIRGLSLANASADELAGIHAALGAGLAGGTLRPRIAEALPLAQAAQAHGAVMRNGKVGKIVLRTR
jgi:NADPH2:quinone reductase